MDNFTQGKIIRNESPRKRDIVIVRMLIVCGLLCMCVFAIWFCDPKFVGYSPIYWALTFALAFKMLKMVHEWYHYWSVSVPARPQMKKTWKVDMLTTACPGEPREMIIRTITAMARVRYPHTSYLCDEGDDPVLKQACKELGVVHVTRKEKKDAKAGNINNALRQATGEICVVLDPDHVPVPEFLDQTLPYFEDDKIGFVQCVQAYSNQNESLIARGAAEQTYHFYGPMMMCMNTYGTAQAIGANCTFRRSALDSIGGHAAGLAEDMHTAMQLHAKGWKSVYIPEILTRGLVPATLSSYYQQQLKWSRGTFELLFRTYPQLFKGFTWRQKIHYFTVPLYFLFGLVNLIDIFIPVLALGLAHIPWAIELGTFASHFIPLCVISLCIRMFAQRWLLEKHERGFHFAGGFLRMATWWIFLLGFVYSIFNIKVPYIPTPKEDEHQNCWKLSAPNILVALLIALLIWYGLSIDWTPYSLALAFYAAINCAMLCLVVMLSQQKLVAAISKLISGMPLIGTAFTSVPGCYAAGQRFFSAVLRNGAVTLLAGVSLAFLSYTNLTDEQNRAREGEKILGGFYTGTTVNPSYISEVVQATEKNLETKLRVVSFNRSWTKNELPLDENTTRYTVEKNIIPFINWSAQNLKAASRLEFYNDIVAGEYNSYLRKWADALRKYSAPVFICFEPGSDNGFYGNKQQAAGFVNAWQYIYTFLNNLGVSNTTWVWRPATTTGQDFYPGVRFVDWIGVDCLNYGDDKNDDDWFTFSQLYEPFRKAFGDYRKPVIISELGSPCNPSQAEWFSHALKEIAGRYEEIHSLILFTDQKKIMVKNKETGTDEVYISDFSLSAKPKLAELFSKNPFRGAHAGKHLSTKKGKSVHRGIAGRPGKFSLIVNGKPYYIKGIAYNTAHDWRDGNMPLTRRQLEKDFARVKAMGANTIRRYDNSIYDRNVLSVANECGLKVLYGFWFDPKVDYYTDSIRIKKYMAEMEQKIIEHRHDPAVLGWALGNETWGLLKHTFSKPYLTLVRNEYAKMIELMAQRIHELDPARPVFSCIEHEEYQLPGELATFHDQVPSVDIMGINSYYREQISRLNHVAWQFDSLRPYLISEFGPRGYWDPKYNRSENGNLVEDNDQEKAVWYAEQWSNYVSAYKGYNVGGFAYCWHDRMEGSYTWFGITDYMSRPKPAYFALKEAWTGKRESVMPLATIECPQKITPGQECTFSAKTDIKGDDLNYEWMLLKDSYLKPVNNLEPVAGGKKVIVSVPEEPSEYRLYLYVSDSKGNVSTSSAPVTIK
jgi:cellulose synthase (UDP-forming)